MNKIHKKDFLDFFKKLNIEYLNDYKYEIDVNSIKNKDLSDYYLLNIEEFSNLEKKYRTFIQDNFINDVYINKTLNKGYGLFALNKINKDCFIGVYWGVIKEAEDMVQFDESGYDTDYAWDYPDELPGIPLLEINAKYAGNELRFVNHDENPNVRVEHTLINNTWYIFFVADRDINENEELYIYYGEDYWSTEYRELT